MSDKLSERICRIVWAFSDERRREDVRSLAKEVAKLEDNFARLRAFIEEDTCRHDEEKRRLLQSCEWFTGGARR